MCHLRRAKIRSKYALEARDGCFPILIHFGLRNLQCRQPREENISVTSLRKCLHFRCTYEKHVIANRSCFQLLSTRAAE